MTKWLEMNTNEYACSKCSKSVTINPQDNSIDEFNYCPFCGRRMLDIKSHEDIFKDPSRSPFYCTGICESCKYGKKYNNGTVITCDEDKLKIDNIYPVPPEPPPNN